MAPGSPAVLRHEPVHSAWRSHLTAVIFALVVTVALVLFPEVLPTSFWVNTGILALLFASAAGGWNVLGGYTGQISFGNAVFFGTGAYTTALLVRAGWSPWPTFLVGAGIAAAIGVAIGLPCFRLRSHYFAIATIAIGEIVNVVATSMGSLGGSSGLQLPLHATGLSTLQFSVRDPRPYYYLALVLFALVTLVTWLLVRARTGIYLRSIRDNEQAAAACGVPVWRYKLIAVAVSAALTALPGSLYAMYVLFVDPSLVLDLSVSINIVLIAVLGGAGSLFGPLIGAWVLISLQEYTRVQLGGRNAGLDLLIFGVLIIAMVMVEPGGVSRLLARVWAFLVDRFARPGHPTISEPTS